MPKPISVVEQLPEAAQQQVLAWLEVHPPARVVEMMAKPEPDGFGVHTHVTTLIAVAKSKEGHADHFWSFALGLYGALSAPAPMIYIPRLRNRMHIPRNSFCG